MVWYSHLLNSFPQLVVIHTVKGFGVVNKAEIDVFLELSCFFDDLMETPGPAMCGWGPQVELKSSYCDRLNQTEASGKGDPADPFRTQDLAWQETRLQVSGLGRGRVSACPDPCVFHSLSNSYALGAVPIMCVITHPVS